MRKLSIVVLGLLGACGGDDPPLSAQEQGIVLGQLFSVAGTAMTHSQPPPGSALVGTPAVFQVNETEPCPSGGSVGIAGMASGFMDQNGNGQASADFMITFTSCGTVPVNGQQFIINGAPYLSITSMGAWAGGAMTSGSMTFSGAFCWNDGCAQGGDSNQVCDIRVTFDLVRASGSGHICDNEINFGR